VDLCVVGAQGQLGLVHVEAEARQRVSESKRVDNLAKQEDRAKQKKRKKKEKKTKPALSRSNAAFSLPVGFLALQDRPQRCVSSDTKRRVEAKNSFFLFFFFFSSSFFEQPSLRLAGLCTSPFRTCRVLEDPKRGDGRTGRRSKAKEQNAKKKKKRKKEKKKKKKERKKGKRTKRETGHPYLFKTGFAAILIEIKLMC
jgi:hypothetical protein